jgi:hypothetical protein
MDSTCTGVSSCNLHEQIAQTVGNLRPRIALLLKSVGAMLCTPMALLFCKAVIGIVSGYDLFLTIKYVESLPMMEMNPVGRWLMGIRSHCSCGYAPGTLQQMACFITAKFFGNFITFGVIEALAHWRRPMAATVATTLAFIQLCLLYYLLFGSE